jgi:hypothetical protein
VAQQQAVLLVMQQQPLRLSHRNSRRVAVQPSLAAVAVVRLCKWALLRLGALGARPGIKAKVV